MMRPCLIRSVVVLFFLGLVSIVLNLLGSELLQFSPREVELVVMGDDFMDNPGGGSHKKTPVYLQPEGEDSSTPIVMWWTPFTGDSRVERQCKRGSCIFTHSRTELNNSRTKAFMYYGTDIDWKDLPLPRRSDHLWALLHEESPKNNWILASDGGISLFNLTATPSRYSSYPLTTQFLHKLEWLERPCEVPTHQKSTGSGLGLVFYLQSDCNPPSDRDSYVQQLMKYISVDSYGKCLHNRDLPSHLVDPLTFNSKEILSLIAKYKFTIAFENARCHDYITEKFWRPLYAGSVPIAFGSPTIKDWAPTNQSIIVAEDFESPKDLAKFLHHLDQDETEYERYLEFKRTGISNPRLINSMRGREWVVDYIEEGINFIDGFECHVCDTIHRLQWMDSTNPLPPLVANRNHYDCQAPEPALKNGRKFSNDSRIGRFSEDGGNSELRYWRYVAKCSSRKGKALRDTLARGGTASDVAKALHEACNTAM